jgi:hypothetical protein
VEGAVFGLMGLLLAFTFSGAASRFEVRRQLIVQETNAIGTAYLRLDLLPPGDQPKMREDKNCSLNTLQWDRPLHLDPQRGGHNDEDHSRGHGFTPD